MQRPTRHDATLTRPVSPNYNENRIGAMTLQGRNSIAPLAPWTLDYFERFPKCWHDLVNVRRQGP
jgi:hypothetical protein